MLNLLKNINTKKVEISIVGLGYVGLPLCLRFLNKGFKVTGIDKDLNKIKKLKNFESYISSVRPKEIRKAFSLNFKITNNFKFISKSDVIIVCVPTPIKSNKVPEMKHISDTAEKLTKYIKKEQILILESTVYPGATEEFFLPIIEKKGFIIGENFFLGYSPEREDPGNNKYSIFKGNIPKVVAGYTNNCKKIVKTLYSSISKIFPVSSIKTAEFTKLLENVYRSINIGFINEMKLISSKMGINIHECISAAKTKPFGFQAFYPGPGLGGHCIPVDPYLLAWQSKKYGLKTKFIELSGKINESMPLFIVKTMLKILKEKKISSKKLKILILGLSYKKNSNDVRESPAFKIISLLNNFKHSVFVSDPNVSEFPRTIGKKDVSKFRLINLNKKILKKFDLTILVTDHDKFDYKTIQKNSKLVIDCRNRYKKDFNNIFKA